METPSAISDVVERNIEALLERARRDERPQDRIVDTIIRFTGSLGFVFVHAAVVLAWVLINVGWLPLPRFDPTFVLLATVASVEAIFLTAFVLMAQRRMQSDVDRRADLDVQISLLTEHELTKLIKLVNDLAAHSGVKHIDPEIAEIQRHVTPETILDTLEKKQQDTQQGPT
jgi:uncharacterized membrane protein